MAASLKHLDKTGGQQITGKNWGDAYAGVTQSAEKFFVQNDGDRTLENLVLSIEQVGENDGYTMLRIGADTATVIPPYGVAATLSGAGAGGVWSETGLQYYRLTATNATGETTGSVEVSVNVDVTSKKVTLTWTPVTGATGYKIYRSTTAGSYGSSSLRATLSSGSASSYVDDGGALSAGTVPSENTTAGGAPDYGTAPSLGTGPLNIGDLAVGQQWVYWVNRVIPAGTDEDGNPRLAQRQFAEG